MPVLPPVPKAVRLDLFQTFGADARVRDRIFCTYAGTFAAADMTTLALNTRNGWNTNIAPLLVNQHQLTSVIATDLTNNTNAQGTNSTVSQGTNVGVTLPAGVAAVIRLRIGRRYRGGHPRFYLCGLPQADLNNASAWSAAAITAIQSGFANFINAALVTLTTMGALTHVNVHYFKGFNSVQNPITRRWHNIPTLDPLGPTTDVVNSYVVNPAPGAQRRRNLQSA